MKTALIFLIFGAALSLVGCSSALSRMTGQQEMSFQDLPPLASDKGRVVLVFDQGPLTWRLFPTLISVDDRLVLEVPRIRKFVAVDVEPGKRKVHFGWGPSTWDSDAMLLDFEPRQTRYFYCENLSHQNDPHVMGGRTLLVKVQEIDLAEAVRRTADVSVSPSY